MWIIIFGTTGKIVKASPEDILPRSCPTCRGDLVLSHLKRYFTLFFIPLFPTSTVDTFYECRTCKQKYSIGIKQTMAPFTTGIIQTPVTSRSTQGARHKGDQTDFRNPWTSQPFFCSLCGKKHVAGTPRMHCHYCVRSVCVDQYSVMIDAGKKGACPDCGGELESIG